MAEKTRIIAARLVRFEFLSKGGEALSHPTRHIVSSIVHWPRYAYQARTTSRELEVDGAIREFSADDWIDAILFKESVQLPSAVSFSLSVPAASETVAKVVAATVKAGLGAVGDLAQSASASPTLGKIATAPFDALAALVGGATEPSELGRATLLFNEALLSRGGERSLQFTARRDITTLSSAASATKGPGSRRRKIVVRTGDVVANAVIAFDALG